MDKHAPLKTHMVVNKNVLRMDVMFIDLMFQAMLYVL